MYRKPVATVAEAGKTKPVWLRVDLADDGKFSSGSIDIRGPFKLGEGIYEAEVSVDGASFALVPTTKPDLQLTPKPRMAVPLLKEGTVAPDFSAEKAGGGSLKLSDYRGKVVLLAFWSTWNGPTMPHIEKVSRAVKDQGVVVLSVCVWDEKPAYESWLTKNQAQYGFQFAFDPAARDFSKSIASTLYSVTGLPVTYVIDKEGTIAAGLLGVQAGAKDSDQRLEAALKALGIKLE
jgi:peroxiredoxin